MKRFGIWYILCNFAQIIIKLYTEMKKVFIMLLSCVFAAGVFCSCQGPMGPVGPKGDQGEGMNWEVLTVSCPANSWKLSEDKTYFHASVNVPQLTKTICDEGMVQCYVIYSDGTQALLPTIRFNGESGNDGDIYWQRLIDYEFSEGVLDLFYTNSDFYYETGEPDDLRFRLVLQW